MNKDECLNVFNWVLKMNTDTQRPNLSSPERRMYYQSLSNLNERANPKQPENLAAK